MASEEGWELQLVSRTTGEVLESKVPVVGKLRRKRVWTDQFVLGFQNQLAALAAHPRLTQDAMRVLLYLVSQMEWENRFEQTQRSIAEYFRMRGLKIGPARVSRAMRLLRDEGLIVPLPQDSSAEIPTPQTKGRAVIYQVNAELVWKGLVRQRAAARKRFRSVREKWKAASHVPPVAP